MMNSPTVESSYTGNPHSSLDMRSSKGTGWVGPILWGDRIQGTGASVIGLRAGSLLSLPKFKWTATRFSPIGQLLVVLAARAMTAIPIAILDLVSNWYPGFAGTPGHRHVLRGDLVHFWSVDTNAVGAVGQWLHPGPIWVRWAAPVSSAYVLHNRRLFGRSMGHLLSSALAWDIHDTRVPSFLQLTAL